MRQKHNNGAEQENNNMKQKHTLKNTTARMLVKKEQISSSLRRSPWRRYVLCAVEGCSKLEALRRNKFRRPLSLLCSLYQLSLLRLLWQCHSTENILNKHYCVLSNSGLSNATAKRPKLAFFCGKICPPKSRNCQNRILHISKVNFYFGFRWYSR